VDEGAIDALVENKGLIKADGGVVVMTAKAAAFLQMATVSNSGVIEAHTIQNQGGRIMLISDMENGQTTVSGTLDASAPNGGNGGFIETSGRELTVIDGATITTLAPFGSAGTWLIDPVDFTVSAGAGALTTNGIGATTLSSSLSTTDVTIATDPSTGGNGDIVVNSTVNISSHTLSLLADGAVMINAGISGNGGELVLQSGRNGAPNKAVTINSSILLGGGKLKITSTGGVQSFAEIQAVGLLELYGTGAFNLNYTGNISDFDKFTANVYGSIDLYENSDYLYIQAAGVTATGNVTLRVQRQIYVEGPISITGSGNLVLKISGITLTLPPLTPDDNFINTTSPITLSSGSVSFVTETGIGTYTIGSSITTSGGSITFDQPVALSGSITASGGGITFDQLVTLSGSSLISCNGLLTFNSTLTPSAGSDTIFEANDFLFNGSVTGNNTQQITLEPYAVSGNMTIGTGGNIDTALSNISGFTSLTFGRADGTGTVTLSGPVPKTPYLFTSSIILQSGGPGGAVVIDNPISTTSAPLTLHAGGILSINQSVETQTGTISLAGDIITVADKLFSSSGGDIIILANSLTLSGTATLSSAGQLAIAPKTTGTTIGIAGGSGTLALPASYFSSNFVDGFSNITIGNATTGDVTVGGDITLSDNFSLISGGSITVNGALAATGNNTIALKGTGSVTEGVNGSLVADQLVLLGGNVTLDNTGNKVATLAASGVDNLTYLNSDALTIGTAGVIDGINTTGTVNVATLTGNLIVSQTIATSDASTNAVTLNAGRNTDAQISTGGDIIISGGSISVGAGGLAKLYTGSISGSSGLTSLIVSGSGNFRYASDESTANYSAALSSGTYAIYREQPLLTVTPGSETITYGDTTPGLAGTYGSFANGDTSPGTVNGTATWMINGSAPTASYTAGSYNVTYSSGLGSSLGYGFTDNVSSINELTVNKALLTVTGIRAYTGTNGFDYSMLSVTGAQNNETITLSAGTGSSGSNIDVGSYSGSTLSGLSISVSGGNASASNYLLPGTGTMSITRAALSITANNTSKTYGQALTFTGIEFSSSGLQNGETLSSVSLSSSGTAANANVGSGSYDILSSAVAGGNGFKLGNYDITYNPGTLTINPKTVTLSATKIYDGTTSLAGAVTIVTGVGSETLTYSNAVASDANVATANKSISTITLADGSGLASNYQLPTLNSATAPLTISPKIVTLSATKSYDGTASLVGAVTIVTGVGGETLTYTNALASDTNVDTANNSISMITLADGTGLASNYQLPSLSYSTAPVTIISNQTSLLSLANRLSSSVVSSIPPASISTTITGTGDISSIITTSEGENSPTTATGAEESSATTTTGATESNPAATTVAGESSSATSSSSTTNAETSANTESKAGSNAAATRAQMDAGSMRAGFPGTMPGSTFNVGAPAQIMDNTFATSSLAELVSSPDQLSLSSGTPVFGRQRYSAASKKTKRSDAPPDPVAFGTLGTLGYLTVYLFAMFNRNR